MAAVTVFVDDAVLGHLPPVCVKEGVPTADTLSFTQDVSHRTGSGLGVAWLLVLVGPIGWLGLFVISALRGGEMLSVTLPMCEDAYLRSEKAQRTRRRAGAVFVGAVIAAFLALLLKTTDGRLLALGLAVVACGALVKMIVASIQSHRLSVPLDLDASRRWVTLNSVHPNFAAAVQHNERSSVGSAP
jgi:hypothetical protein